MASITCGIRTLDTVIIREVFRTTHTSIKSFATVRRFRQNRHFQRAPLLSYLNFLLRLWQMFAIFAIFAKYAIFAKIATLKGNPLLLKFSPTRWRFFLPDSPFSPLRAFPEFFFPRTALRGRWHHGISLKRMWVQTALLLYGYNCQDI